MSNTAVEMTSVGSAGGEDGAESFLDKAKHILTDLLEVKVVTAVGDVNIQITTEGDSTKTTLKSVKAPQSAIVTVVKIADGDVTTVISEALLTNTELRAFHSEQLDKSLKVLPDNLRALVDIARTLRAIGSGE